MSEFYVGPELPYDVYKKHFKKEDTYLESKKGIEEMYAITPQIETEMIAFPDPTTFQILPWRPDEPSVAKINCDILNKDGSPSDFDSRYIFRRKNFYW